MEVVIVKMTLQDYEVFHESSFGEWLIKEQYLETEEIKALEILININKQIIKDDNKRLHELKHPHKQ